jgi:integrase
MTSLENAVDRSSDLRPRTKELYLQHVRAFLAFVGDTPTRDVTEELVKSWCVNMRRRRISPQSVNVALTALRYAAVNAHHKHLADHALKLRLPVAENTEEIDETARALTWDEGRQLVGACNGVRGRDLRDNALITLGLRTGMLRFSMCQLKFDDIDLPHLTFVKKGGVKHAIRLDTVTTHALRAWMRWLKERDITKGCLFRSLGRQRVGPSSNAAIGDQLTPDGLYRALRERARKAGLDDLHPHVFRKTFLAWAKEVGAQPRQVAAVTGHKSDAVGDDSNGTGITVPANMLFPAWTGKKLA